MSQHLGRPFWRHLRPNKALPRENPRFLDKTTSVKSTSILDVLNGPYSPPTTSRHYRGLHCWLLLRAAVTKPFAFSAPHPFSLYLPFAVFSVDLKFCCRFVWSDFRTFSTPIYLIFLFPAFRIYPFPGVCFLSSRVVIVQSWHRSCAALRHDVFHQAP